MSIIRPLSTPIETIFSCIVVPRSAARAAAVLSMQNMWGAGYCIVNAERPQREMHTGRHNSGKCQPVVT